MQNTTQNKAQKKRPGSLWSLVLAYLSTLLLVVLAALLVLAGTVCSANYMERQVSKSAFSNAAYNLLVDNYTSYAAATGFESTVLTQQLSAAQIQSDMEEAVRKLYAGDTAFDRRAALADTAYAAMQADLESRGVELTDTVKSGIEIVADACRSDYAGYVSVPLASQLYTAITKVRSVLWFGIAFAALCSAAALVLTVKLAPNARTGIRCLIYLFTAAAALCLLVAFALYPSLRLSGFKLEPTSMRLLVLGYIKNAFGQFGVYGIVYAGIAAALLALTRMAHAKAKQRMKNAANM